MPAYRFPLLALPALAAAVGIQPALRAQTVTAPSGRRMVQVPGTGHLHDQLERMRYNADQRGPLICIAPEMQMNNTVPIKRALPTDNEPGPTPLMLADAFERRLFTAGSVTALAPREMTIINTNPGKANPLADMRPDEVIRVLLGTLSQDQWQKIGSSGIGLADLNKDQAAFMRQMLPPISAVRPNKVVITPDKPGETSYEDDGDRVPVNPEQFRLRISRMATYMFAREGNANMNYLSGTYRYPKNGERIWNAEYEGNPDKSDRKSAYGVKIVQTQPNHLKQGELDFAAPALDVAVSLDSSEEMPLKTLGDLMVRVQKATKLDLRVDTRLAGLSVYSRTAPGQTVRAGDLLMAIAYSVTGAYRRLGPRLFLLTDDVEGIGTRFARLNAWAMAASAERQELLAKYQKDAAQQHPLQFLSFSAGYNTLPDDVSKKVEDSWKKERWSQGVRFPVASLPDSVRKDVEAAREVWANMKEPIYLTKEQVTISIAGHAQWVLPNGTALEVPVGLNDFSGDMLRDLSASDESQPMPPSVAATKKGGVKPGTTEPAAPVPPLFPSTLMRRIILVTPESDAEARQLVNLAYARGFSEVWVRLSLEDTTFAPLKAAITAAKPFKMPVVAIASLLKDRKSGEEDRNILGLTGTQWADEETKRQKDNSYYSYYSGQLRQSAGWLTPPVLGQENLLQKRLVSLAAVPGIAGVCVTNTTPPGYGEKSQYGDGLSPGSEQGYTLPQRIGFLTSGGYDPIDIIQQGLTLDVDMGLPFFSNEWSSHYKQVGDNWVEDPSYVPPIGQWKQYRVDQVHQYLAAIHNAFRTAAPKLPLYIEDRKSSYASPNLSWYGTWDSANRLPDNPMYSDTPGAVTAAHAASSSIFLRVSWQQSVNSPDNGILLADMIRRVAKQAEQKDKPWAGMALDMSDQKSKDVVRLLEILPRTDSTRSGTTRQGTD